MNMGPRHPRGLIPCSRYRRMVSWETRARSPAYLSWISLSRGWSWVMPWVIFICLRVRGRVIARIITVNTSMVNPKLWNRRLYRSTRLFSMGSMMTWFHRRPMNSKALYLTVP